LHRRCGTLEVMGHPEASLVAALHRNLARALGAGELEEATLVLERLRREDPLSVRTRGGELELLLRSKRLDDAEVLAVQLMATFPASPRVHYLAGRVAYQRRDYPAAVARFEESLRVNHHWRCHYWLGKALTQAGRLQEAEAALLEAVDRTPLARRDLAWLYERMGDAERALATLEEYLQGQPDDTFAQSQVRKLRARVLDPAQLCGEVEALRDLGEAIPPEVLPEYVDGLLRTGQGERAREVVAALEGSLDARTATQVAWVCHRLQVPDLACRLLLPCVDANLHSAKTLSALEANAVKAGRVPEVLAAYRSLVDREPRLWSRVRRLQTKLKTGDPHTPPV